MTFLFPRRSAALFALAAGLSGCDDSMAPDQVVLQITALTAPATIAEGETLVAQITVQSGGCRRFDRIVSTRATGRVTFRALGLDSSRPDGVCTGDIRTDVVEWRTDGPFTDPFLLVGVQPSGEEMRRTVHVVSR